MSSISVEELRQQVESGRYAAESLLGGAMAHLARLEAENAALRLGMNVGQSAESSHLSAARAELDIDSWREGVKFALAELSKHELCFISDSMQFVAVKLVAEAACVERDAMRAQQEFLVVS